MRIAIISLSISFFSLSNLPELFYLLLWMWNNVQQNHRFFFSVCFLSIDNVQWAYYLFTPNYTTLTFSFQFKNTKRFRNHVTFFNDSYWKLSTNIQENEFFHFIGNENNIKTGDWKRFSRHNFRTSARNTNVLCSDDDRHRLNYYLIFKQNTFVIVIHFFPFLSTIYFRNGIYNILLCDTNNW